MILVPTLLFLFQHLVSTGGLTAGYFPALWFGTIPSTGFPLPSQYNFSNYSLVLLGFTYPDPHNEQTLLLNAERVRQYSAPSPPPVFVYRNGHIALKSFDLQAQAMATLPNSSWIRNTTVTAEGGTPCRLFDGSLAYNFSVRDASQFFLDTLVPEVLSESSSAVSGVFFDEVDWATCGFLESECGAQFSEGDKEGLWQATAAIMASTATLLSARGKSTVQSLFSAFRGNLGSIDSQPCRHAEEDWLAAMPRAAQDAHQIYRFYGDLGWFGTQGQNTTVCEAYIQNMIDEAQRGGVGKVVRAVLSPTSSEQDVEALAAAALLSLDAHTHIGFSTGWGEKDWKWWPILGKEIGVPLGNAEKRGPAWVRQFSKVTAEYSCETRAGSLTWVGV